MSDYYLVRAGNEVLFVDKAQGTVVPLAEDAREKIDDMIAKGNREQRLSLTTTPDNSVVSVIFNKRSTTPGPKAKEVDPLLDLLASLYETQP